MLTDGDYVIRIISLPERINGLTVIDNDCIANIYINASLTREQQKPTLQHELAHVERNDLYRDFPIIDRGISK